MSNYDDSDDDLANYEFDWEREMDARDPYWRENDNEVGPY